MPPPNPKNFALSAAATDLGLGDMIKQQLEDDEADRKKKLLQMGGPSEQANMGSAAQSLFGVGN